ncbi:hypothetical protein CIB95_06890 [Lottiidibacillus patelloidae]|uniref:Lipoprotein n=1 Tax=Lottiidibacillus patelloidae TaxID=2670334 RepID=A0A263BV30_9BACI|nr:hypothetical protein [Lottiidibacillus patelloidae]OZM57187.1 hypothetical protein CIB95_06890 [Lottiidibacillus patelloidae]
MNKMLKLVMVFPLVFLTSCFDDDSSKDKNVDQETEATKEIDKNEDNEGMLEDDVRLEIIDYYNYMYGEMLTYHNSVISYYDQVLQAPDEVFYGTVIDKIIPQYTEILVELEKVNSQLNNEDLIKVHEVIVSAVRTQLDGFLLYKKAYENNNNLYVNEGNEKIREANTLFIKFDEKMSELMRTYEINHFNRSE